MKKTIVFCLITLLLAGCGNNPRREKGNNIAETVDSLSAQVITTPVKPNINVYIENSGSMDGYVKGDFKFKEAISSLLAKLPYHYDEKDIKILFINGRIDSVSTTQVSVTNFAHKLDLCWKKSKQTRSDSTNLNSLFKDILAQTDSKTISILFSDCIYSVGKGNVTGLLTYEKNLTMSAFLQKYKNEKVPLATTIVKMNSKFDGKYYPFTGDKNKFSFDGNRPYYICVIASQEILTDFNKNIEFKAGKIAGFENKYVLSSEDAKSIYYSVLHSTYNKGRFKPDREMSNKNYIHGIEDVDLQTGGGGCSRGKEELLSFAISADFSKIQAEDDYLRDIANYMVTTNNFSIDTIMSVDKSKIKPSDWNRIAAANPTHIIILTAKTKAVSDVAFVLKKQMPKWINDSHTEDDTDKSKLEGGKTFGLYYWVKGVEEAYETIYPNNKNFFECSISINQ